MSEDIFTNICFVKLLILYIMYILPTSIILYIILFVFLYSSGINITILTTICVIRETKKLFIHVLNIPTVDSLLSVTNANGEVIIKR